MKKENAAAITKKQLNELTESLRQGQTDALETYLNELTAFQHSRIKSCSSIAISLIFLRRVYEMLNVKLTTQPADEIQEGSRGRNIVSNDQRDESMQYCELANRLAYELLLRDLINNEGIQHQQLIAAEAECVAFVVCKAQGIQTQAITSDSTCWHRDDNELLVASLWRIEQSAMRIIELIEADRHAPINIRFSHRSRGRHKATPQGV